MTMGNHAQTPAPPKVPLSSWAVTSHLSCCFLPPSLVHPSLTATCGGSVRRPQGTWGYPGPPQGQGGQPPPVSPGVPGAGRPPHAASCKRPHCPAACAGSSGEEAFAASSPPATPHCTFLQVTARGLQGGRLQGHWGSKTCTGRATVSLPTPGCSPQPPRAAVGKLCTQDVGTPRPTLHFTPASHLKVASNHVTALHAPLPTSQHHRHRGPPAACQSSHPASTSTALPANCKKLPHNPSPRLPHPP